MVDKSGGDAPPEARKQEKLLEELPPEELALNNNLLDIAAHRLKQVNGKCSHLKLRKIRIDSLSLLAKNSRERLL